MSGERSAIGKRIKQVQRKTYEFPVEKYFSMGNEVERVAIRVPTKREQDLALEGAHSYIAKLAAKTPALSNDPEIVNDAKSAFIVAACCLDPTENMIPVWPTGEVVTEDLTTDQIGVMVRLINEVRAKDGPTPPEMDESKVEALALRAAEASSSDYPDDVIATLPHPYLVQLYMLTALKLKEAREECAALGARVQELKAPKDAQGQPG